MDGQVRQVVEALAQHAGPGGVYERTLLLVSGDHGQTLGGDHGGGSPEEVDSALVAVDLKALHASRRAGTAAAGRGAQSQEGAAGGVQGGLWAPAACRANCTCGVESNQCAPDLLQMDLTPTLAAMLGVPIPFGNLGKLSWELWQLAANHLAGGSGSDSDMGGGGGGATAGEPLARKALEQSLVAELMANARQVRSSATSAAAGRQASGRQASGGQADRLGLNLLPQALPPHSWLPG